MSNVAVQCSFCGKGEQAVWRLVAGPGVYVCGDCVSTSFQILCAAAPEPGNRTLRVVSQAPDGTVRRCEHGPLPDISPAEQGKHRWLTQCRTCGTWNVGEGIGACLECGTAHP